MSYTSKCWTMNKIITFLLVLLFCVCQAATGNANDGQLFAAVIISLVVLILGIGYFIDFTRKKIKEIRTRKLICKKTADENEDFLKLSLSHTLN